YSYVCALFTAKSHQRSRDKSQRFKEAYDAYFDTKMDPICSWAPDIVCLSCYNRLSNWYSGRKPLLRLFLVPTVWREQQNHFDDCYFCASNIEGVTMKHRDRKYWDNHSTRKDVYAKCASVSRPVSYPTEMDPPQ